MANERLEEALKKIMAMDPEKVIRFAEEPEAPTGKQCWLGDELCIYDDHQYGFQHANTRTCATCSQMNRKIRDELLELFQCMSLGDNGEHHFCRLKTI